MLLPPFRCSSPSSHIGLTDKDRYINVDWAVKAIGAERIYAVGNCLNFAGQNGLRDHATESNSVASSTDEHRLALNY
jgi:hypothetical protein